MGLRTRNSCRGEPDLTHETFILFEFRTQLSISLCQCRPYIFEAELPFPALANPVEKALAAVHEVVAPDDEKRIEMHYSKYV